MLAESAAGMLQRRQACPCPPTAQRHAVIPACCRCSHMLPSSCSAGHSPPTGRTAGGGATCGGGACPSASYAALPAAHIFSSTMPLAWEAPAKGFFHSEPRCDFL